jgi:hypothetical protein
VLGFALIGPALLRSSMSVAPALAAAWLGVVVAALGIAATFCLIPVERLKGRMAPWLPYLASGVLCLAVALIRVYRLWQDWLLLR